MARALRESPLTPTDELRALLTELERRLADTHLNQAAALTLMQQMDRVADLVPSLQDSGMDLRPELGRLEAIEGSFRKRANAIVGALGASLGPARQEAQPPADRWWWQLDAIVRQQRMRQMRRLGIVAVAVALVVVFVSVIVPRLFPVDPAVSQSQRYAMDADLAVMNGDFAAALAAYRQAAEALPTDATYHIWIGVLSEQLGNTPDADAAYAQARILVANETEFLVTRGQAYLQIGQAQEALADTDAALALTADSAQAYFIRASAYELLGQAREAMDAFQTAADLANEQGDATLTVLARVRMGYLMQGSVAQPPIEASPTP